MAAVRNELQFLLNDQPVRHSAVGSSDTLLDYLRLEARLRGTKEGCAEGDCGACTVLVGRLNGTGIVYETVNACIRLLASVDLCHVVTIEHLGGIDGDLHPVQQAMVDHHGSQCGFCTPGIVMSLYALWMQNPAPNVDAAETALQGNLCRCTGYRPIIDAALSVTADPTLDPLHAERQEVCCQLNAMADGARVELSKGDERAILPADLDDLAVLYEAMPDATLVAGSTDVGLWVTKFMADISPALLVGHLDELRRIDEGGDHVTFGAGVSYSDAEPVIAEHFSHLSAFWRRIGGWQVRNMGTLGGNIANGSPIGDTPPALIALGASIGLRRGDERREIPLEDFFIDYGKQDRQPGEFVAWLRVPKIKPKSRHAAYKISKRRDEDISSIAAGFSLTFDQGIVGSARLAFGGMAATPSRAQGAERALLGKRFDEAALEAAQAALADDFRPITDWRASADYRARVARNLLRRFWLEVSDRGKPIQLEREVA